MLAPEVFPFLKNLKENNNREWFKEHKTEHDEARNAVVHLSSRLFESLNNENQLDKHKVFRIYRDVRFSKHKTPYKTHFGISFHRQKPAFRGGYYLHVEPGASFLGVGFWGPNKDDLFRIRKEIEMDHEYFSQMVSQTKLFKNWGQMQGEQLKTVPKGFEKDAPGIEHLRFKQFIFIKNINDDQLIDDGFGAWMTNQFKTIKPFLNYMGEVLNTDLNGESII